MILLWRPQRRCEVKLTVNIKGKECKNVDLVTLYGSRYCLLAQSFKHFRGACGCIN
jgi:hypothetical protein